MLNALFGNKGIHQGQATFSGALAVQPDFEWAPLSWRIKNAMRWGYISGRFYNYLARQFSKITGRPTLTADLSIVVIKSAGTENERRIKYGKVGYNVVTTAFVNFLVDNLVTDTTELGDFKFHDSGTDSTAEAVGDTDMGATDGIARVSGTQLEGASANIYRSVATLAYDATRLLREHGLFSQLTGGTLLDRTVFALISVDNGDSVQYTYELTVNAGG